MPKRFVIWNGEIVVKYVESPAFQNVRVKLATDDDMRS